MVIMVWMERAEFFSRSQLSIISNLDIKAMEKVENLCHYPRRLEIMFSSHYMINRNLKEKINVTFLGNKSLIQKIYDNHL